MKTQPTPTKPKLPPVPLAHFVNRLREQFNKARRKMVPPPVVMFEMVSGMWLSQAIGVAAELGIADVIGDKTVDYKDIAPKVGASPEPLYRLMRALTIVDIFKEVSYGHFKLTVLGRTLRSDVPDTVRAMAIFQSKYQFAHWGELMSAVKTGDPTVAHVRGKSFFEFMAATPDAQAQFDIFMTTVSTIETASVLAVYDFSKFNVIADVGGGHGSFLAAILEKIPTTTKGILFDQPQVVQGAYQHFSSPALKDRCQIVAGDFFASVPDGADAYVMKHIIHDWEESRCIQILKNIRKQIPQNGKLILIETVVPAPGVPHFSKLLDIEMLVAVGGKERTEAQYAELFTKCGFKLEKVTPTVSMASIIEGIRV